MRKSSVVGTACLSFWMAAAAFGAARENRVLFGGKLSDAQFTSPLPCFVYLAFDKPYDLAKWFPKGRISAAQVSANQEWLVAATSDNESGSAIQVQKSPFAAGRLPKSKRIAFDEGTEHWPNVDLVGISDDGKSAAVAGQYGLITVNVETGVPKHVTTEAIRSLSVHPTLLKIATGSAEGELIVWERRSGIWKDAFRHRAPARGIVTALAFSPNGKYLAVGSRMGTGPSGGIQVWELTKTGGVQLLGEYVDENNVQEEMPAPSSLAFTSEDSPSLIAIYKTIDTWDQIALPLSALQSRSRVLFRAVRHDLIRAPGIGPWALTPDARSMIQVRDGSGTVLRGRSASVSTSTP